MNWYLEGITKKYAQFDGRARRMEYWMFALINFAIAMALMLLDQVSGLSKKSGGLSPLYTIYVLITLIPSLAVTVRRLHDINYSGLHIFIAIIPLAGPLLLLAWMARAGDSGRNNFGKDPLGREKKKKKKRIEEEDDEEDQGYEVVETTPKKKRKPIRYEDDE